MRYRTCTYVDAKFTPTPDAGVLHTTQVVITHRRHKVLHVVPNTVTFPPGDVQRRLRNTYE